MPSSIAIDLVCPRAIFSGDGDVVTFRNVTYTTQLFDQDTVTTSFVKLNFVEK